MAQRNKKEETADCTPKDPRHVASEDHFLLPHASSEDRRTCSNSFVKLLGSPDKPVGEKALKTVIILCNSQYAKCLLGARHFICTASHSILTTSVLSTHTGKGSRSQRGNRTCPEPYSAQAVPLGVGNGNPLQYSCLENSRRLEGYSPRGCKELDMTEHAHCYLNPSLGLS